MKNLTIALYDYKELSTDAKKIAHKNFTDNLQNFDFYNCKEAFETLQKCLLFFDYKITDYSFDFYNATTAHLPIKTLLHQEEIENLTYVRLSKYITSHYSTNTIYNTQYNVFQDIGQCPITGMCYDYDFLSPIKNFINKPTKISFKELIKESTQNILKTIEKEYQYYQTESYFISELEKNEQLFLSSGKLPVII